MLAGVPQAAPEQPHEPETSCSQTLCSMAQLTTAPNCTPHQSLVLDGLQLKGPHCPQRVVGSGWCLAAAALHKLGLGLDM